MTESARELIVVMTHGSDHELSSVAFTIATGGMATGLRVAVFLTSAAVDLVRKQGTDNTVTPPFVSDFLKRGGRLWACMPSVKARGYRQNDLIAGVEIAGPSKIHELIRGGAATLSF
jgi:predicted peroxiredoxin